MKIKFKMLKSKNSLKNKTKLLLTARLRTNQKNPTMRTKKENKTTIAMNLLLNLSKKKNSPNHTKNELSASRTHENYYHFS